MRGCYLVALGYSTGKEEGEEATSEAKTDGQAKLCLALQHNY